MKKLISACLALLMLMAGAWALAEDNLIQNGGFTELDGDTPAGWQREMWLTDAGISLLSVDDDGFDGPGVSIVNVDANDARFAQTVRVEPNRLYRLSAMVRAEDCDEEGCGASLSIGGLFVYSEPVYDTHGQWDYVELYGRTGPEQTELTVFVRVGGYGKLSTGRAWFDDVELAEVDDAPAEALIQNFYQETTYANVQPSATNEIPARYTEAWLMFACVYALIVMGFIRKRSRTPDREGAPRGLWLALTLIAALVVRIAIAARVPGYHIDVNDFAAWSDRMFAYGPFRFYDPNYFCDYPPGYMLLLWPVGMLRSLFALNSSSAAYRVILKGMPILADLASAYLVWRVARRKLPERGALMLAVLCAFNPAAIANSAAWGQIDAVLTLAVALCALAASEYRYVQALLWFAAALLIKPQALLFAPLGLAAMVMGILRADGAEARLARLKRFGLGVLACLGVLYAAGFICTVGSARGVGDALAQPVPWLINLYSGTMQGYRCLTVNALNLYELLGLNWARMEAHPTLSVVSWALFGLAYAGCIALYAISAKKPRRLFLLGGALILLISAFGPMMHERYAFPAMLLLTLAFAHERDARVLISLIALTVTLFLNEVLVLQGGMTAANYGHLQESENWLNRSLSLIVILNALLIAWTAFDLCARGRVVTLRPVAPEDVPAGMYTLGERPNYRLNLRRIDALLIAGVTLAYSAVAFVNLGVTKAPQTGWTSSVSGESVVFDLGESQPFRMTYYGGICNSTFTVALSDDGENWSSEAFAQYNQGEIFRWIWFTPPDQNMNTLYGEPEPGDPGAPAFTLATAGDGFPMQKARLVRITAQSAGLNLLEVGFLDADGHALPILGVQQSGQTAESNSPAALLVDEQKTVAAYPSYLNSTYFDEIYHARTAYEHLHGMSTYEYTHPPLGKVWMMLGVKLFGMTPFGWRFMGTLAGILMLPLMYLLVKQLTKSTPLSAIAMGLLALDSMHFTQTRIATIDSYAVFWIMLMYLFMFRYCQMSWNRESLGRTLVPLGLCGVSMGFAWATKWIGIYASIGLALIFFWTVVCRLRESAFLRDGAHTAKNLCLTLAFCLVFFIVVPAAIYYFSYYWHLRGEGLSSFWGMFSISKVRRVIQIQESMFRYHAGLGGDTHYFRSPWYQWPVIWWPMWYYSGTTYMPDGVISSISCMGNPAVWWFGLVAMVYVFVRLCWDRRASRRTMLVVIGFASQFLPWVIVPRSTFIYHYFASVPFIIIASVLLLDDIRKRSRTAWLITSCVLLAAAAVLFGMFYPLESGLPVARAYANHLRWFKWYNF